MDSCLRRLHKLILMSNGKQCRLWRRQQFKQTYTLAKIYGKFSKPNRTKMDMHAMTQIQQLPEIGIASQLNLPNPALLRNWDPPEEVSEEESAELDPTKGLPFKIVSYNILAQDLLVEHLQYYKLSNQMYLKWSYRFPKLIEEILSQKPEIICLQEVQANHLGDIVRNIRNELPMSCVYKKKTGFRNDGCAIFYNTDMFELVFSDFVEFYQPDCDRLNRHNIALVAKLRCKSKPEVDFLVCTTHLLYNPRREDVRLAQTMVLLAELDRHSVVTHAENDELQRIPVILTGDFNFQPHSAPFELIVNGKLCYEPLSVKTLKKIAFDNAQPFGKNLISSRLGITDACQHINCINSKYKDCNIRLQKSNKPAGQRVCALAHKPSPELFSTGTLTHGFNFKSVYNHSGVHIYGSAYQNDWITPDHLFFSEAVQENQEKQGSIKLSSVYQLPSVSQCRQLRYLPNAELGSDHLMLASCLYLAYPDAK